jgi:erythromycin esterase
MSRYGDEVASPATVLRDPGGGGGLLRLAAGVQRRAERRAGFHGLDVYSLWESLREILVHLREHDPDEVPAAGA